MCAVRKVAFALRDFGTGTGTTTARVRYKGVLKTDLARCSADHPTWSHGSLRLSVQALRPQPAALIE